MLTLLLRTLLLVQRSLLSSHHNKLVAEKELQRAVTGVAEWSTSKEMVLNADKCEVTIFSTNSHKAKWQPTIIANNTIIALISHTGQVVNLRPAHPEHQLNATANNYINM